MVLRGQGDSPVRICEPCKKLEEAARFELRHGRRPGRGIFIYFSSYGFQAVLFYVKLDLLYFTFVIISRFRTF